jgi:hypothetical protein
MPPPTLQLLDPQPGIGFDEAEHRYTLASKLGPVHPASATQVLTVAGGKAFDPRHWRRSLIERQGLRPHEADAFMDKHRNLRADIGTELHSLIRAELLGLPWCPPKHAEPLQLLATWRQQFLPRISEVLLVEVPLASLWGFYTGTPDLLARVDGQLLVVDWKTKASEAKAKPEASWALQLGGYAGLILDQYGLQVDGALNLMVWPGGTADVNYNRADMLQARDRFYGFLRKHHEIRAVQGCSLHRRALQQFDRELACGRVHVGVV